MMCNAFNLSDEDIKEIAQVINQHMPDVIIAYPSVMYMISQYIENNNLRVHAPEGIICAAETLFEFQRDYIQKIFSAKVLNRYGCRDVGHIASECAEQKGLHISADHVIVEVSQ